MNEESGPRSAWRVVYACTGTLALCLWASGIIGLPFVDAASTDSAGLAPTILDSFRLYWRERMPLTVFIPILMCICLSAFFSGSEAAYFSIQRVRLRSMSEEDGANSRLVARLMEHPSRLLTAVLVGNTIVNILIGLLLGTRIESFFVRVLHAPESAAYILAVASCTAVLVIFGEILPKVFAMSSSESSARTVAVPLQVIVWLLSPICKGLLALTDLIFRVTRFHELRAAPFITDEELKSVFEAKEAQAVIQDDERQMIQGILEFNDVLLREILVPRTDMIAIPEDVTVAQALEMVREHEYSRMPVYRDDLDHITGVLVAKDLLPSFSKGDWNRKIKTLARPPHFVPETMTVQQFVKDAQRHRCHLAIVVDEYGGTAGVVALENAFEEVVGDLHDENDNEPPPYIQVGEKEYRVQGSLSLDQLRELVGLELEDEEHATVSGFLMNQTEKILEPGDTLEHHGVTFTVEACDGKRASWVLIRVAPDPVPTPAPSESAENPS